MSEFIEVDVNNDGVDDLIQVDVDADGGITALADTNGDGLVDIVTYDADGDGVAEVSVVDSDYDGVADHTQYSGGFASA